MVVYIEGQYCDKHRFRDLAYLLSIFYASFMYITMYALIY